VLTGVQMVTTPGWWMPRLCCAACMISSGLPACCTYH
jgi:hypothetical protein